MTHSTETGPMSETEKAQAVRRMLSAGRELSDEQRMALLRLHQRFEQLWEQRWGQPQHGSQRHAGG